MLCSKGVGRFNAASSKREIGTAGRLSPVTLISLKNMLRELPLKMHCLQARIIDCIHPIATQLIVAITLL
jgi:hypothetical protein